MRPLLASLKQLSLPFGGNNGLDIITRLCLALDCDTAINKELTQIITDLEISDDEQNRRQVRTMFQHIEQKYGIVLPSAERIVQNDRTSIFHAIFVLLLLLHNKHDNAASFCKKFRFQQCRFRYLEEVDGQTIYHDFGSTTKVQVQHLEQTIVQSREGDRDVP